MRLQIISYLVLIMIIMLDLMLLYWLFCLEEMCADDFEDRERRDTESSHCAAAMSHILG